jgi:hypothetical protein
MKKLLASAAMGAAMIMAGAASAATLVATTGTPLAYHVHNPGAEPDGNLTLDTVPGGFLVDYSSTDLLHDNGSSGGFAKVSGLGGIGGSGFSDLTIDPENPLLGFTAIKFNLIIPGPSSDQDPPNGTDFDFDVRVYFLGGGFQDFLDVATSAPDRYLVADPGQVMTKIIFSNLDGDYDLDVGTGKDKTTVHVTDAPFKFDGIEQVSFNAVAGGVPEPGVWAMMLVGFFGMGAMLRRRGAVTA